MPKGFVVPECTLSPDGRYGVTVPLLDEQERLLDPKNGVIEVKTGKIVAAIKAQMVPPTRKASPSLSPLPIRFLFR